jgi:threonine dehydratase
MSFTPYPQLQPQPKTPHESYPDLAREIGVSNLYFKREDLHPLGSHKGRSIPRMIDVGLTDGIRHFVISSSGNAALAAGLYVKGLNAVNAKIVKKNTTANNFITLEILAGKNINTKKLAKLQVLKDEHILVSVQDRPLQMLFQKTKVPNVRSLRQSTDPVALEGYTSLARELADIPDLEAIFIGTSSGTTAQALAQYFLKNGQNVNNKDNNKNNKNKENTRKTAVEIHIVQTPSCHPIVTMIHRNATDATNEISIADAIVDRTAERASVLAPLIEKSGGTGWTADNESIKIAQEIVRKHTGHPGDHGGLIISPNSALSVAGLMNAVYTGRTWHGAVVCMMCGD